MTFTTFLCPNSTIRWQELPSGEIEIEGQGIPTRPFPVRVNDWAEPISRYAKQYDVPASWVAAIMGIESGGIPNLCYRISGQCSGKDGAGLMAMLPSTATALAGRSVSINELMSNTDLAIELGIKFILSKIKLYGKDFVKSAISYNANTIKCSSGSSGSTVEDGLGEREPCAQTPWGVIMGCVRSKKSFNQYCTPSIVVDGMYACPVNYPLNAISMLNSAIAFGWSADGFGSGVAGVRFLKTGGFFLLGSIVGFVGLSKVLPGLPSKKSVG